MISALNVKKNTESQSIAAVLARCSVGKAKAASTATPGTPSISARSELPIATQPAVATSRPSNGIARWCWPNWRRQHHSVHSAIGQAGHKNHSHSRANCGSSRMVAIRQAQLPLTQAISAAARVATASQGASAFSPVSLLRRHSSAAPKPQSSAIAGAPLAASAGKPSRTPRRACQPR